MAFGYGLDAAVALFRVYFVLGPNEVCACGVLVHVHCMSMVCGIMLDGLEMPMP